MKILLLGSGGREHAFAWKIVNSNKCEKLYVAPGNAGTGQIAENVNLGVNDFESIREFVLQKDITMVVVGPEEPLVRGIVDYFAKDESLRSIPVIGPDQKGATLEGSKDFSKKFMTRHGIPTAAHDTFTPETVDEGVEFIKKQTLPIVLKADGLAAGKGVLICQNYQEAEAEFRDMLLNQKFGEASSKVVVEEFLQGIELSVFVVTDGENYKILPAAKDYKRIGERDTGLNTGGMGAVSPVPFADDSFISKVEHSIVQPTIQGLHEEGVNYKGFLFIGLMNVDGEPKVIEYNVRMGDPETQAVLPRIKSDFLDMLYAVGTKTLSGYDLQIDNTATTTIVMVAGGYPDGYEKGNEITGLPQQQSEKAMVFHAGTKAENDKVLTSGGRVLGITGRGNSIEEALKNAYKQVEAISWKDVYYRKDIGQDILNYGK
ncbi:phosphoribosylamine--glycine ligase [Litoribacter alkaliphilus]|uniref:Phosphoribosylamine--glycine ligase n=1 Tax=Litoribacter ruber TaxID=702568 RepID=A0AAP2CJB9_9BACT|nr:phosphoribosylamine--glycine ligase [Litoribacter alkaliphilus]MBS9522822.1 phosphoribosylamine--glycine ligase [Litoribacter alkaliphilus]